MGLLSLLFFYAFKPVVFLGALATTPSERHTKGISMSEERIISIAPNKFFEYSRKKRLFGLVLELQVMTYTK